MGSPGSGDGGRDSSDANGVHECQPCRCSHGAHEEISIRRRESCPGSSYRSWKIYVLDSRCVTAVGKAWHEMSLKNWRAAR